MKKPPVLLVPVDFSETSRKALELAKELSPKLGAEIVILHVFEPPPFAYPDVPLALIQSVYQGTYPAAQRALAELAVGAGGVRSLFREGSADMEILRAAEELSPEFIIMGTHGRRGVRRLLLGSVAEQVIRHAHAPVVTVRGGEA